MSKYQVVILGTIGVSEIKKTIECDDVEYIGECIVFKQAGKMVYSCPQALSTAELING